MAAEANMTAGSDSISSVDPRTIVALVERVAVIETRMIASKEDTAIIRATHHEINNRMQEFVAAERLCAANLGTLVATQTTTNAQISELTATVKELTLARAEVEGAWKATIRLATFAGAILAGLAASIGGLMWSLGHLSLSIKP